jgi:hypothetical protein
MSDSRHILRLSCGITCELTIDEASGQFSCEWSERPTLKLLPKIEREYIPWRNSVLAEWAGRNNKRVMVIDA